MNLWHDISAGNDVPNIINVIVECPKGSKNKYEIDKENGLIKLDRAMKSAQDYPFDYGFIPQSYWDDGDALDVVLLTTYPLAPGILVEARPVAVIRMIDCGDGDDKIVAVPKNDPRFEEVLDLQDINKHTIKEIQHFFETYKSIEGKIVEIRGVEDRAAALETIQKGIQMYKDKFAK